MLAPAIAKARRGLTSFLLLYAALYAGFGVVSPFLPTFLKLQGLQPAQIGIVLAVGTAARLVSGPLAGRIADALGALPAVFACFAVSAALTALGFLFSGAFSSILIVNALYAAMLAPLATIADALALAAARRPEDRAGFEYGWVRGCGSAAFIFGSVMAGAAIGALGLAVIIWGGSAFLVAAAASVLAVPSPPPATEGSTPADRPSAWSLLRRPQFRLLLVIAALVLGSHAMHDSFAVIRWEAAGITPATASLLWSESVAAEVVVFVLLGPRLLDRIGATRAMTL
ncbi:MAG: MFS transporter, partial [Xanthobacteraceae bacterium]|nr:MFS transporter [Xanthobacteraceae bacterium]